MKKKERGQMRRGIASQCYKGFCKKHKELAVLLLPDLMMVQSLEWEMRLATDGVERV